MSLKKNMLFLIDGFVKAARTAVGFGGVAQTLAIKFIAMMFFAIMFSAIMFSAGINASHAATGPWQGGDEMQARLITAIDHLDDRAVLDAGLEVKLAPGWKIYWRSPGEAGLPPQLDFSRSKIIKDHAIEYPAPKRFSILGFDSFGYADHVIYPLALEINPTERGNAPRHVTIFAEFDGLVCKDVCIPLRENLTLALPKGAAKASSHARDIAKFKAKIPRPSTASGVEATTAYIEGGILKIRFQQNGQSLTRLPEDVIIEAATGYAFAKPEWQGSMAHIAVDGKDVDTLKGSMITITAVAKNWLLEGQIDIANTAPNIGAASQRHTTDQPLSLSDLSLTLILVAFLGGVILNIMPCVLPVISLKLGAVMGKGDLPLGQIRMSFIMTALGVVASFLTLGAALLALRQAGVAIGWGIQFQQPIFLGLAALAILGFGLVMLDVIQIPIPQFAQNIATGGRSGLMGDFLSGALATLLATPCSAPFVGTAVAFALAAPAPAAMSIFLAMGLGLAMPWIMVAMLPKLAHLLPKPGAWFITLKRILAAGLFATAIWLLSIMVTVLSAGSEDQLASNWKTWQPQLAEQLTGQGDVVFVDVTADWCLTCKANKALVLNTEDMAQAFADQNIVLLQADWTKPDDRITAYLASFDRYGIPFNIVYGPGAPSGIVLPELLTRSDVLTALKTAKSIP